MSTSKAQAIRGVSDQELLNLKQEVTMAKKKQVGVRYDNNRTRLKTGETQRPNGTYAYRWSTPDGKRHSIYAPTLERLREQEEQIIVDKHDGIMAFLPSSLLLITTRSPDTEWTIQFLAFTQVGISAPE